MSDGKPDLKVVSSNPTAIFDDLPALRKASKLTVQRKSVLVNVTVGRPPNDVYFHAHPEDVLDDATILRDSEGTSRAHYFVVPHMRMHPKLTPRLRHVTLALVCIWPGGAPLIWPVPILGEREFKVWKSARAAYELSRTKWTQMVWNEEIADYTIETAENIDHEPTWPDKDFGDLLKLAFDGKVINSEDHPYVRRLRGILD